MTAVRARYYDGHTSTPRDVDVEVFSRSNGRVRLVVRRSGSDEVLEFDDVRIEARVGQAARLFELPGGATLEVPADAVDGDAATLRQGWVHALESRWPIAIVALLISVAFVWATMQYGVPALARRAVDVIPPSVDSDIGAGGLALLDDRYFRPSQLDTRRQATLQAKFAGVAADLGLGDRAQLVFRDGGRLEANAFALPSGIVVVTDQLVQLAQHDDELRAVFAHELGHVAGRHSMRMLLQSSANAVLMVGLFGDVSAASSLTASVPTVLVQAANSRDFEREADAYARKWLRGAGIPVSRMGDLLARLDQKYGDSGWSYLSSHPPVAERLKD